MTSRSCDKLSFIGEAFVLGGSNSRHLGGNWILPETSFVGKVGETFSTNHIGPTLTLCFLQFAFFCCIVCMPKEVSAWHLSSMLRLQGFGQLHQWMHKRMFRLSTTSAEHGISLGRGVCNPRDDVTFHQKTFPYAVPKASKDSFP